MAVTELENIFIREYEDCTERLSSMARDIRANLAKGTTNMPHVKLMRELIEASERGEADLRERMTYHLRPEIDKAQERFGEVQCRTCFDCRHCKVSMADEPCWSCFDRTDRPNWEPHGLPVITKALIEANPADHGNCLACRYYHFVVSDSPCNKCWGTQGKLHWRAR